MRFPSQYGRCFLNHWNPWDFPGWSMRYHMYAHTPCPHVVTGSTKSHQPQFCDKMRKFYKGPYIDVSCQVWFHLTQWIQRTKLKCAMTWNTGSVLTSYQQVLWHGTQVLYLLFANKCFDMEHRFCIYFLPTSALTWNTGSVFTFCQQVLWHGTQVLWWVVFTYICQ